MEVETQNTHIDMMLITEENKSTEFLYCLSLKKIFQLKSRSSWEGTFCIFWASEGMLSKLHCGKFSHEIIFYSNQTDILQLISTYKNKRSSRPGRYSKGLIKLWSVEIYSLTSLFCYLERFLFLLLLLRQMFSNCAIILTHNILANSLWSIIQSWYCSWNVKLYIIKPKVVGLSLSQLSLSPITIESISLSQP